MNGLIINQIQEKQKERLRSASYKHLKPATHNSLVYYSKMVEEFPFMSSKQLSRSREALRESFVE